MGVKRDVKPDSVALHPVGATGAPEVMGIFGTGDLGRSLGLRLLQSGYRVVYGSRRPHSCGPVPQGAEVTSAGPRHGTTADENTVHTSERAFPFRWRPTQKQPRKPP